MSKSNKEEKKLENLRSKLLSENIEAYQNTMDSDPSIFSEDEETNEHPVNQIDELKNSQNEEEILKSIKSKCKFKQEYVDQKVILSVNHLKQYFYFGSGAAKYKLKAVHDVSFQVHEGECFGLVGESGCGKTTTGRSIIRLYNITSGSIYYKGYRIGAGSRWNEKEIKYTKIRFNKLKKELSKSLKNGEISKEEFDKKISEAKTKKDNIIKVQKAKINQIHYDDKKADSLGVYDDKITVLKKQLNELEKNRKNNRNNQHYENEIFKLKEEIKNLKENNHRLMSEIQMIFQDPIDSLDPRMTVESIITEGLQIQGLKNKKENHQRVIKALDRVGLIEDYANRYPHEFSGGQRQRIGIARALVMNPRLLICDEPISALDVSIRAQIINLLNDLKDEMNLSILFIAHDLSVVKYFCDRIAVMYFGEIVELTSTDELFKHPLHPYTKSLLSAIPKPNPYTEKKRHRIVYNPQLEHDYSTDKPSFVEILPGHFVLANSVEIEKYKQEIAAIDANKETKDISSELTDVTISSNEDEIINSDSVTNEPINSINEETSENAQTNIESEIILEEKADVVEENNEEKVESTVAEKRTGPIMTIEEVLEARKRKEVLKERNPDHKKVYHLKKVDNKWKIILKEGKKVIKTFDTKEEALKYGKALAKSQDGTLLVHASKGKNKGKFQKA